MSIHGDKIKSAKAVIAARFAAQTIEIDADWRIIRADEFNWEIQHKAKEKWVFQGYYGKLPSAFQALTGHMLNSEAKASLNQCVAILTAIQQRIEIALKMKLNTD